VTPSLYYGFLGAESKGKYLHQQIKFKHKFTKRADNQASK
jgi:hypothetical protein